MKKYIFIILLILSFADISICQTYTYRKFPTSADKPIWVVSCTYWMVGISYGVYGMFGDTLINKNKYSKLYSLSDTIADYSTLKYYFGCTREDSLKRVFVIYNGESNEKLLFDFSKNKGDEIFYNPSDKYPRVSPGNPSNAIGVLHITDINTEYKNNIYIKYYELTDAYNMYTFTWIEGIGNLNSVLSPIYIESDERKDQIVCFKKAETMQYGIGGKQCFCQIFNHIPPNLKSDNGIKAYPNPSKTEIIFKFNSTNNKIKTIQIISQNGKIIFEIENINSNIRSIPVSELPKGMNFYIITDYNHGIYKGKLIIN
jgi:hypothetical protein